METDSCPPSLPPASNGLVPGRGWVRRLGRAPWGWCGHGPSPQEPERAAQREARDHTALWGSRTKSRQPGEASLRSTAAPSVRVLERAVGPGLQYLGHACDLGPGRGRGGQEPMSARAAGGGGGLSTSEFLLFPAEDLCKLPQLLAGGLRLLLQPLVVLPQAGHLRLQHRLVLLLLRGGGWCQQAQAERQPCGL